MAVTSGQYRGQTLLTSNAVGPLYGEPAASGDHVTLLISTYADGSHNATVYEHDRSIAIGLILAAFLLVTVLVGGKTGAKSILGLAMTVAVLVLLLIPLLLKGWPTVWTVFLLCSYIAVVCFVILGGVNRKILCACLGTIAGMALATVFGLGAQALAHVNGLRISDVEPLLQLRQTGTPIGLRGLLVGGIIISSLGAGMDGHGYLLGPQRAEGGKPGDDPGGAVEIRQEHWKGHGGHHDQHLDFGLSWQWVYPDDLSLQPGPALAGVDELQLPGLGSGQRRLQRHRRHFGSASDNHHRRPAFIQETMTCSAA